MEFSTRDDQLVVYLIQGDRQSWQQPLVTKADLDEVCHKDLISNRR